MTDGSTACPHCGTPVPGAYPRPPVGYSVPPVPNHMVGAILTTLFCCLIGGIISIVYASQVNTKLALGDYAGAQTASRKAKNWIVVNIVVGIIGGIIGVLVQLGTIALALNETA